MIPHVNLRRVYSAKQLKGLFSKNWAGKDTFSIKASGLWKKIRSTVCVLMIIGRCACILGPLPQWGGLSLVRGFLPPPSSIHLSSWASASSPSHSFIHMFSQEQCSGFPERILHTQRSTVLNIESHTDTNTHMYEGKRTHALTFIFYYPWWHIVSRGLKESTHRFDMFKCRNILQYRDDKLLSFRFLSIRMYIIINN